MLSAVPQGRACRAFHPSDSEEGSKDPDPVLPSNDESTAADGAMSARNC